MKTSKNRGTYYSPFTIMADERTRYSDAELEEFKQLSNA